MPYLGVRPADITSATQAEIAGDLTVDTNTLKVDAANNRVGVANSSPATALHVSGGAMLDGITVIGREQTTYDSGGAEVLIDASASTPPLICHVAGSEKIRFQAAGGISFNGDTAAANALDDFEEGSFDVSFATTSGSVTVNNNICRYVKIGNYVHTQGYISINAISSPGGYINFGGLPFTSAQHNESGVGGPRTAGSVMAFNITGNNIADLMLYLNQNTTTAFLVLGDGVTQQLDSGAAMTATTEIMFSLAYIAA